MLITARRIIGLGWALFVTVLKRRMAYRGDLFIQSLDELMRGGLAILMVQVYLSHTDAIDGWGRHEILFILGFAMVPLALFHCFCSNLYGLANRYLIQGEFDRILLRPYPSFLQVCFDRIAVEDLSGAVLGSILMGLAVSSGALGSWSWPMVCALVFLILCAFAIVVAVFMTFAAASFWFDDRVGMVPPVYNLMEFSRWPVSIYNHGVKILVTLVIPFGFCAFYPASLFLPSGQSDELTSYALATPFVALIALTIACTIWKRGIRRYGSVGH